VIGHPVHENAATVLRGLGGDPAGFAARQLTARIAADADLVLTMTRAHRDKVLEMAPRLMRRTFTLAEAASLASEPEPRTLGDLAQLRPRIASKDLPDVPDPINQEIEVFEAVGTQIADLLSPIVDLCRRSGGSV
jgi:protein-tyrosine phosphatase